MPGLYVRVLLPQGVDEKALVVPAQAIQRSTDGNSTLVLIKDGAAVFTPVQVGVSSGQGYIITSGLEAGDQVITAGFQKIRPGAPVQAIPPKSADVDGTNNAKAKGSEQASAGDSKQTEAGSDKTVAEQK